MKSRSAWLWGVPTFAILAGGVLHLVGCGEQDLYKPPHSPYQIAAKLLLASAPEDVHIQGNRAYVAGGQAGLVVVDISNPFLPTVITTFDTKKFAESIKVASIPFEGRVIDIAFVVEGTEGITTYNVTDPDSVYSFEQGTTAVDGNGLFIEIPEDPDEPYVVYLAENWKGMRIFESDAHVPGLLRYNGVFSDTRGYAKAIAVQNGYAYVADDQLGVAVVDVRERVLGDVKVVSWCDTPGESKDIAVDGDYAYIADGANGLIVMSIHGAEPPVIIAHLPLGGVSRAIEVRDGKVFLAAQDSGLHIVGVDNPASPVLLGTVVTKYANGVGLAPNGTVVVSDRDEGLVVFTGGGPFRDRIPPGNVNDLVASTADSTGIFLTWHAPGDDLFSGTASQYDIRYSLSPINAQNWENAPRVSGAPAPSHAGTEETFRVGGLAVATEYYFAIRTGDEVPNWSDLSNVASAFTATGNVAPVLTNPSLTPTAGGVEQVFVFRVTYRDAEADPPTRNDVVISGDARAMTLESGDPATGAVYKYESTFPIGSYEHTFAFEDGRNPVVQTPVRGGPYVGDVFQMGSPEAEPGRDTDERLHMVVMTRQVVFEDHEVTQSEYQALMGTNPSRHQGPNRPVENVTWYDAVAYCNARSTRDGLTPAYTINGITVTWNRDANGWRLPTEAEWERTCRAGTSTAFANGPITELRCGVDPSLSAIGWYCGNAGTSHREVKQKAPNAWNLYDMHGNVWEWCWDWYVADLGSGVAVDPAGPPGGSQRAIRGGSWYYFARDCRSAARAPYWPNSRDDIVGFRVVRNQGP